MKDLEVHDEPRVGRFGTEWVPRVNGETSLENLVPVQPRIPHRRVEEGKEQMGPSRLASQRVAQSAFDAAWQNTKMVNHDASSRVMKE